MYEVHSNLNSIINSYKKILSTKHWIEAVVIIMKKKVTDSDRINGVVYYIITIFFDIK